MLISKKIKKLNKLARLVVAHYTCDESPDYVMIGLENDGDIWTATVMYENCGDRYPQYIVYDKQNCLILYGEGKTLAKALDVLESRFILFLISAENKTINLVE